MSEADVNSPVADHGLTRFCLVAGVAICLGIHYHPTPRQRFFHEGQAWMLALGFL